MNLVLIKLGLCIWVYVSLVDLAIIRRNIDDDELFEAILNHSNVTENRFQHVNLSSRMNKHVKLGNFSFQKLARLAAIGLDLSNNRLEAVDVYTFWHQTPDGKKPLPITELNLSSNNMRFIPWRSISSLRTLDRLIMGNNQLTGLNLEDDSLIGEPFDSLKEIILPNCQIEFIDPKVMQFLINLSLLDLSYNRIRTLDDSFSQAVQLKLILNENPLDCNCSLRWVKAHPIVDSNLNERLLCYVNVTTQSTENSAVASTRKRVKLTELADDEFICDLELTGDYRVDAPSQTVEFNCEVRSYPASKIVWYDTKNILRIANLSDVSYNVSSRMCSSSKIVVDNPQLVKDNIIVCKAEYESYSPHNSTAKPNFLSRVYEFELSESALPILTTTTTNFIVNKSKKGRFPVVTVVLCVLFILFLIFLCYFLRQLHEMIKASMRYDVCF